MPLVYPRAIIERVVEKILLAAESFARKLDVAYRIITSPIRPIPSTIITFASSVRVYIWALRLFIAKISYALIGNPAKPSPTIVGTTSPFLQGSSLDAKKQTPSFSLIRVTSLPVPNYLQFLGLPYVRGDCEVTQKPSFSYSIVSSPSRPVPVTSISFNTSVGVRKSP